MTYQSNNYRPNAQPTTRYRRTGKELIGKLFSSGPYLIAVISFVLILLALVALQAMDVITGQKTVEYMSNEKFAWFSSLGTTGLLCALIGTAMYGVREGWSWKVTVPIFLVALIPSAIDVYFDGLSADIVRYGHFVVISELAKEDQLPQIFFRILIAGLSFVGEPLAATSTIIFPVLKELFNGALGNNQ